MRVLKNSNTTYITTTKPANAPTSSKKRQKDCGFSIPASMSEKQADTFSPGITFYIYSQKKLCPVTIVDKLT
jgi:hypothetical protein